MSQPAHYQLLGLIGHIIPSSLDEHYWTGSVSGLKRVRAKEITEQQIQRGLQPEKLETYFVPADRTARSRCIDGRCSANYDPKHPSHSLGTQVPGGTATAALCWRIATWGSMFTETFTLTGDIATLSDLLEGMGLETGGHIDDQATDESTGCGSLDKVPEILQRITLPEAQEQVRGLLQLLLGESYERETADAVVGRLVSLQGKKNEYFDRDPKTGNLRYRQEAIDAIKRKNPEGVEKLVGDHHEVGLVINTMPETTFDRDRFSADHDHKLQLFNFDFWRTLEVAEKLFPIKTSMSAEKAGSQQRLRLRYITTRALFGIGTAMVLTDGEIELIIRSSNS